METVGASQAIIGIKKSYVQTVKALQQHIEEFPGLKLHLLDEVYPMGDEVVLIYEATGRVCRPGGLPIEQGVIVFNVETIYNVYPVSYTHLDVYKRQLIIRVPVIPTFNDTVEEIRGIASFADTLPGVEQLHLLPYHRLGQDKYVGCLLYTSRKAVFTALSDCIQYRCCLLYTSKQLTGYWQLFCWYFPYSSCFR